MSGPASSFEHEREERPDNATLQRNNAADSATLLPAHGRVCAGDLVRTPAAIPSYQAGLPRRLCPDVLVRALCQLRHQLPQSFRQGLINLALGTDGATQGLREDLVLNRLCIRIRIFWKWHGAHLTPTLPLQARLLVFCLPMPRRTFRSRGRAALC